MNLKLEPFKLEYNNLVKFLNLQLHSDHQQDNHQLIHQDNTLLQVQQALKTLEDLDLQILEEQVMLLVQAT
jgi:hypothetical protein